MVVHLIEMSPQYDLGMGILFDNKLARAFNFLRFDGLAIWIGFCRVVLAGISAPAHEKAGAGPEAGARPLDG